MIINENITKKPSIEEQRYLKKAMHTLQLKPLKQKTQIASPYPTSDRFLSSQSKTSEVENSSDLRMSDVDKRGEFHVLRERSLIMAYKD